MLVQIITKEGVYQEAFGRVEPGVPRRGHRRGAGKGSRRRVRNRGVRIQGRSGQGSRDQGREQTLRARAVRGKATGIRRRAVGHFPRRPESSQRESSTVLLSGEIRVSLAGSTTKRDTCDGVGQRVPYYEVNGGRAKCPVCGYVGAVKDDRDGSVFTFAADHYPKGDGK